MSLVPNVIFSFCLKCRCYARAFLIGKRFSILYRKKKKKRKNLHYLTNYFLTCIKTRCISMATVAILRAAHNCPGPSILRGHTVGLHVPALLRSRAAVDFGQWTVAGSSTSGWKLQKPLICHTHSPLHCKNNRGICNRGCPGQPGAPS